MIVLGKLKSGKKYVQLALDFIELDKALSLVSKISDLSENLIIELGTPLIKSVGIRLAVSSIRNITGDNSVLLADMKTVDTGLLEAELAFCSGADIVTVLGIADDETLRGAVEAASFYGGYVQADMISHPEPLKRALEIVPLGVHIIGLHAGIDVQLKKRLRGIDLVIYLEELRRAVGDRVFLSVAGGIKPEETGYLATRGADIVVIGGAITKSDSPRDSLLKALECLKSGCLT